MSFSPLFLQCAHLGFGNDSHGQSATKAAGKYISEAIHKYYSYVRCEATAVLLFTDIYDAQHYAQLLYYSPSLSQCY